MPRSLVHMLEFLEKMRGRFISVALVLTAATFFCERGHASPQVYGGIFWHPAAAETLYVLDKIRKGDSFELRKALRRHQIRNIILASPGGSVYEALNMSGIIRDNQLRTVILNNSECASACSFLYFAGVERLLQGNLGVHQFSSGSSGASEDTVQYTVSEIIGFLNEFEVPPFVFERMFEDTEMYWFSESEKKLLETHSFSASQQERERYEILYKEILEEISRQVTKVSYTEKSKALQRKLEKLGCYNGPIDGIIGPSSLAAIKRYIVSAGLGIELPNNFDNQLMDRLLNAPSKPCRETETLKPKHYQQPVTRPTSQTLTFKSRYTASCLRGTLFSGSSLPVTISYDPSNLSGIIRINMTAESDTFSGRLPFKLQGKSVISHGAKIFSLQIDARGSVVSFQIERSGRCSLFLIN